MLDTHYLNIAIQSLPLPVLGATPMETVNNGKKYQSEVNYLVEEWVDYLAVTYAQEYGRTERLSLFRIAYSQGQDKGYEGVEDSYRQLAEARMLLRPAA
jgi:hypothetical protein